MWEVLLGGGITLIVAVIFHIFASRELRRRATKITTQVNKVLEALEEAGLVELARRTGKITGIKKSGEVKITV